MADSTTARYADHEEHFRQHFRDHYKEGESHTYDNYEAGYRSGFHYGTAREYAGRDFEALKPKMRRRYEDEHGEESWQRVRGAAQHAFEHGRSALEREQPGEERAGTQGATGSGATASGDPGSTMREGGFDAHREAYQRHHRETHEGERDFSAHESAYRHGHRYGSAGEHRDRRYEDLEPEMRRSYEEQHGAGAWARIKDAVRHAFGNARSGSSSAKSGSGTARNA